jgi:sortase (surface protein transpeptidase)
MKEKADTNEEKIKATEEDEKAKQRRRDVGSLKFDNAHLWEKVPSKDQVIKRIKVWSNKITKMELDLKHKDDNKEVSLGTSKVRTKDTLGEVWSSLLFSHSLFSFAVDQLHGSSDNSRLVQKK